VTLTEKCDCVDSDDNVDHCDIDNHGDLIVHGCFIKKHCHKYQCWRWRRQGYISTITILTVRNDHDDDAGFCMCLLFWWLRRFCQPNSLGLTKRYEKHQKHRSLFAQSTCRDTLQGTSGLSAPTLCRYPARSMQRTTQYFKFNQFQSGTKTSIGSGSKWGTVEYKKNGWRFTTENGQSPYGFSGL